MIWLNLDNFRYLFCFTPCIEDIMNTYKNDWFWLIVFLFSGWSYHQTCTCNPFTCCFFFIFRCCCWRLESWNAVANPGGGQLLSKVVGRGKLSTLKSWVIPKGFPILAAIFRQRNTPKCVWFLFISGNCLARFFVGEVFVQSFKAHRGTTWMMSWKAWN